ncbi:MAG: HEAT repeat domain-containing protein [Planctomycetaceae bacterium]|nr:HEAT repeat domain-containing protein [Planctomycetaceae bacterium]
MPGFLFPVFLFLFVLSPLFAETFQIEGGGTITGQLLNPGERIRQIETADGMIVSLDFRQIRETNKEENDRLAHYKRTVPFLPDTVETHLATATWCRENYLKEQEAEHLARILELDPDHAEARTRLGYFRDTKTKQWTTTEEIKSGKGYVLYKGTWRLPQEVWINEQVEQSRDIYNDWRQDIKQIRASLSNLAVRRKLEAITDPVAVKPLIDLLKKESVPEIRMILIRALSNIGTPEAVREIAYYAMNDPVEAVRGVSLDQVKRHPEMTPQAGAYFCMFFARNADGTSVNAPDTINQAATAIRTIGDTGSVGNLIDALVSQHKETIVIGSGDRTNVGFGNGGTTLGQGQTKQDIVKSNQNAEVLSALRKLTGVDFGYDQAAWSRWYKEKRQVGKFDLRRG